MAITAKAANAITHLESMKRWEDQVQLKLLKAKIGIRKDAEASHGAIASLIDGWNKFMGQIEKTVAIIAEDHPSTSAEG